MARVGVKSEMKGVKLSAVFFAKRTVKQCFDCGSHLHFNLVSIRRSPIFLFLVLLWLEVRKNASRGRT